MKAEVVGFGSTAPEEVCVVVFWMIVLEYEAYCPSRRVWTTSQLCEGRMALHIFRLRCILLPITEHFVAQIPWCLCAVLSHNSIILTQHTRALAASQQNTHLVQRSSRSSPRPSRMGASPPSSRFDPSRSASPSPALRTARSFPTVPSAAASPTS